MPNGLDPHLPRVLGPHSIALLQMHELDPEGGTGNGGRDRDRLSWQTADEHLCFMTNSTIRYLREL